MLWLIWFFFFIVHLGTGNLWFMFCPFTLVGVINYFFLFVALFLPAWIVHDNDKHRDEYEERRKESQQRGRRLKEEYEKNPTYENFKAYKDWVNLENGGKNL